MEKLKIVIVTEKAIESEAMAGCGKNHPQFCGARDCDFNGGKN